MSNAMRLRNLMSYATMIACVSCASHETQGRARDNLAPAFVANVSFSQIDPDGFEPVGVTINWNDTRREADCGKPPTSSTISLGEVPELVSQISVDVVAHADPDPPGTGWRTIAKLQPPSSQGPWPLPITVTDARYEFMAGFYSVRVVATTESQQHRFKATFVAAQTPQPKTCTDMGP